MKKLQPYAFILTQLLIFIICVKLDVPVHIFVHFYFQEKLFVTREYFNSLHLFSTLQHSKRQKIIEFTCKNITSRHSRHKYWKKLSTNKWPPFFWKPAINQNTIFFLNISHLKPNKVTLKRAKVSVPRIKSEDKLWKFCVGSNKKIY